MLSLFLCQYLTIPRITKVGIEHGAGNCLSCGTAPYTASGARSTHRGHTNRTQKTRGQSEHVVLRKLPKKIPKSPKTSLGEKCLHVFPTVPPPDSPVTVASLLLRHTLVLPHTTTEANGAAAGSVARVLRGLCAKGRWVCGCLRVFVSCTGRRVSARCMYWTAAAARRACWAFGHARMGRKTCPRAA